VKHRSCQLKGRVVEHSLGGACPPAFKRESSRSAEVECQEPLNELTAEITIRATSASKRWTEWTMGRLSDQAGTRLLLTACNQLRQAKRHPLPGWLRWPPAVINRPCQERRAIAASRFKPARRPGLPQTGVLAQQPPAESYSRQDDTRHARDHLSLECATSTSQTLRLERWTRPQVASTGHRHDGSRPTDRPTGRPAFIRLTTRWPAEASGAATQPTNMRTAHISATTDRSS
jgi:hypothetical protein